MLSNMHHHTIDAWICYVEFCVNLRHVSSRYFACLKFYCYRTFETICCSGIASNLCFFYQAYHQPFHRDSCDILTKNNILLVTNLHNNYSGLVKLWYFVKVVASYALAKKRHWWVTRYQNKWCWISWLTWRTTELFFQIQSHSCHFVSNFQIKHKCFAWNSILI